MCRATVVAAIALTISLCGGAVRNAAGAERPSPAVFGKAITAQGFRAFDEAISSDYMDGRKPGTIGEERATSWIVEQFQKMGLEPANHGSWFQDVPTVATTLQAPAKSALHISGLGHSDALEFEKDWVGYASVPETRVAIKDSSIVFVGYGINAPKWNWNDYREVDVRGKTVIVLVNDPGYATNDPGLFKGRDMTYYGRWTYKYEEAKRQGAAMCLVVHSTGAAGYPWEPVARTLSGTHLALRDTGDTHSPLLVSGWITTDAARRIFSDAGLDFDALKASAAKRGFKPVALRAQASTTLINKVTYGTSKNVLGMIRGSKRPNDAIVYTAHWDHLGEDPNLKGHKIYNGAIDDGAGIAALLEIARAFKARRPLPRRSVLFAAVTLEESGLLGSLYYTQHPIFAMDNTIADINMDAMDVIGSTRNLKVIGSGQSQLEDLLKTVLREQGRYVSDEKDQSAGLYFRSDHFNFAKNGVPSLYTATGDDLVNGGVEAGTKALAAYMPRYHSPADTFNPDWDFSGVTEDAQTLYELGRRLADSNWRPEWYKSSEFRDIRERSGFHHDSGDTSK